jgi:hypothetical protein
MMNNLLLSGSLVVTLALLFYSVAIIWEQSTGKVSMIIVFFVSMGMLFDISAVTLVILGTDKPFTIQEILRYSALLMIAVSVYYIWKLFRTERKAVKIPVPKNTHLYIRISYIYWLLIYAVTGVISAYKF